MVLWGRRGASTPVGPTLCSPAHSPPRPVPAAPHRCAGDALAAEFVLLSALSRVFGRADEATPLGPLAVNIAGCAPGADGAWAAAGDRLQAALHVYPSARVSDQGIEFGPVWFTFSCVTFSCVVDFGCVRARLWCAFRPRRILL